MRASPFFPYAFLFVASFLQFNEVAEAGTMNCPNGVQTRYSWTDLSTDQRTQYADAYTKLLQTDRKSGISFADSMIKNHLDYGGAVHGYAYFFPWHRYFLVVLEQQLQQVSNNPGLMVPFWDWSAESQDLQNSAIWSTFGGNGKQVSGIKKIFGSRDENVVATGRFSNTLCAYPTRHTLTRNWNGGSKDGEIGVAASTSDINSYLLNGDYDDFQAPVENIHGTVHVIIGGDMRDPRTSPCDPIFYLHHCMIDKIWSRWQKRGHLTDFGGQQLFLESMGGGPDSSMRNAVATDILYPWSDWQVQDVFDTTKLCYQYNSTPAEVQADSPFSAGPQLSTRTLPSISKIGHSLADVLIAKLRGGFPSHGGNNTKPVPFPGVTTACPNMEIVLASSLKDNDPSVELLLVKHFTPVTDEWIKLNKLNAAAVRKIEAVARKFLEQLKQTPGFIIPSSLWNNDQLLQKGMESGQLSYRATVNDGTVKIAVPKGNNTFTSTEQVKYLKNCIQKTLNVTDMNKGYGNILKAIRTITAKTKK